MPSEYPDASTASPLLREPAPPHSLRLNARTTNSRPTAEEVIQPPPQIQRPTTQTVAPRRREAQTIGREPKQLQPMRPATMPLLPPVQRLAQMREKSRCSSHPVIEGSYRPCASAAFL